MGQDELDALQGGGGLVLGELSGTTPALWLQAGARWLLAPAPGQHQADDEPYRPSRSAAASGLAPDRALPAIPEDGALWVLGAPQAITPRALARPHLRLDPPDDPVCALWLNGRPAGQGRLVEHEGLTLVRITEWQA